MKKSTIGIGALFFEKILHFSHNSVIIYFGSFFIYILEEISLKEKFKTFFKMPLKYILGFLFWSALGVFMGAVGGAIGALFSHTLALVTDVRADNPWVLYLLPAGGLIIAAIYALCRLSGSNTNTVFETVRDEKEVPFLLAPAVFAGTTITHLFGGSAGREGAALQIGGSVASLLGKIIHISDRHRHILTMCGMSALFSAMFGTPVGACIFAVEVASAGRLYTAAMYPCTVSSVIAYLAATRLGVIPEHYEIGVIPTLGVSPILCAAAVGLASAVVSIIFCTVMHKTHNVLKKLIKNKYVRTAVGGTAVVLMTLLIGSDDYNGSGAHIIAGIFEGESIRPEAFALKILFTAITMGSGYKGGEIVPTMFIGATLGGTVASLIGMSTPLGAAIGIAAVFCGVTNCPITAIVLSLEMFGTDGAIYYMTAAMISYLLSGRYSLYSGQRIVYSKLDDTKIPEKTA